VFVRNIIRHGGSVSVVIPRRVCKEWKLSYPSLVAMQMNKEGKLLLWPLERELERRSSGQREKSVPIKK